MQKKTIALVIVYYIYACSSYVATMKTRWDCLFMSTQKVTLFYYIFVVQCCFFQVCLVHVTAGEKYRVLTRRWRVSVRALFFRYYFVIWEGVMTLEKCAHQGASGPRERQICCTCCSYVCTLIRTEHNFCGVKSCFNDKSVLTY